MLAALVGEEPVHGFHRLWIAGTNAERRAARQVARLVANRPAASTHGRNPGHGLEVHGDWSRKVARRESSSDLPHVGADRRGAGGIVSIALQLDSATVGERVEAVRRRVLVHAHRLVPTRLQRGERAVRRRLRGGRMMCCVVRVIVRVLRGERVRQRGRE